MEEHRGWMFKETIPITVFENTLLFWWYCNLDSPGSLIVLVFFNDLAYFGTRAVCSLWIFLNSES